ncbi:MAG TPA: tetratricopeptide repeat protein [Trueperaceae bacterium]
MTTSNSSLPATQLNRTKLDSSRSLLNKRGRGLPLGDGLLTAGESVEATAHQLLREGTAEYHAGRPKQAVQPLTEASERFVDLGDNSGLIESLLALGRVQRDLGQLEEASERFTNVLELAEAENDAGSLADALNLKAGVLSALGDYVGALEHLEQGLVIANQKGLAERQANILSNIGSLHTQLSDFPRALESLKAAYELIGRVAPGTRSEAINLISLGHLYRDMGDDDEAQEFYAKARELGRKADDRMVEVVSLNSLANVFGRSNEWPHARELYYEALEMSRGLGVRQYEIDNLDGLGQVYAALGEYDQAREAHGQALAISREIGDHEGEVDALINLGRDYLALDLPARARERLEEGLGLANSIDRKRAIYDAHELLSTAYEREGDLALALHHEREFHRVEKEVFNEESERRSQQLAVQFELERARHEAEAYRLEVLEQAREEAEERVIARTRELEEAQLEIVTRLAIAAEYRDDETGEHTWRVGRNAAAIARALGWSEDECKVLSSAARLHDVGKIGVRDAVLLKPDALDGDEFDLMRAHTTIGASILSGGQSRLLRLAEEIALAHHERWDGKGYPLGLARDAIPMAARIVSVADVLDALIHERPYKRAWSTSEALAEIRRHSGSQFDPQVVEACMAVFSDSGELSPLDAAPDGRGRFLAERARRHAVQNVAGLGRHFGKVLAERTYELEAARREAEVAAMKMKEMAFSDPLTGLKNRRAFETDLESEINRAQRFGDRVAVLTIDLDALKQTNDSLGHEVGDELLCQFGKAIERHLDGLGRVYRVGGDEFSAILANSQVSEVHDILSQVELAVETVRERGHSIVGASAGLAVYPDEAGSPADLTRLSDQRMYRNKLERREVRAANAA